MNIPSIKQPTVFLPLVISLAALALVLIHAALYGVTHEADEGTAAHIFQILMVAQLLMVTFFAIKWLPKAPKQASQLLALQAGAGLVAMASVFFFT